MAILHSFSGQWPHAYAGMGTVLLKGEEIKGWGVCLIYGVFPPLSPALDGDG